MLNNAIIMNDILSHQLLSHASEYLLMYNALINQYHDKYNAKSCNNNAYIFYHMS